MTEAPHDPEGAGRTMTMTLTTNPEAEAEAEADRQTMQAEDAIVVGDSETAKARAALAVAAEVRALRAAVGSLAELLDSALSARGQTLAESAVETADAVGRVAGLLEQPADRRRGVRR